MKAGFGCGKEPPSRFDNAMVSAQFTVRVTNRNPHREGSIAWRAGQLVVAMQGCGIREIVSALAALERDTTRRGIGDPPRWLTHFAGLESAASGKQIEPWIEVVNNGTILRTVAEFRKLVATPRVGASPRNGLTY